MRFYCNYLPTYILGQQPYTRGISKTEKGGRDVVANRIVRLASLAAATIIIFLLLLFFYAHEPASIATVKNEFVGNDWSYGVIIDAGSTGSRIFLYKWRAISEEKLIDIHPVLDGSNRPVVKKVSPGLSSFSENPENATQYMKPLLDYAIEFVPSVEKSHTSVFIFATAGMRLLSESSQNEILKNLHTNLPLVTEMQVIPENIRVIEGKWEGIYSWIAVNYILGRFDNNISKSSRKSTVGMADMGGASVQIAFEVDDDDSESGHTYETINLGCREDFDTFKYRLFATTFLGYGVNEGLRKYEQYLSDFLFDANRTDQNFIRDPCLPFNLLKNVVRRNGSYFVRKGFGDWDQCVKKLSQLIINSGSNESCSKSKCFLGKIVAPHRSLSSIELYGFSEYWYSLQDVLNAGGIYNSSSISAKAREFCQLKWSAIQNRFRLQMYPNADEDRLRSQCFKSAWITAVLHTGFNVDRNNNHFQSIMNISGQEVQWALGAMLYHLRYFPLRESQKDIIIKKHRGVRSDVRRGSVYAMLMFFVFVIFLLFCMK